MENKPSGVVSHWKHQKWARPKSKQPNSSESHRSKGSPFGKISVRKKWTNQWRLAQRRTKPQTPWGNLPRQTHIVAMWVVKRPEGWPKGKAWLFVQQQHVPCNKQTCRSQQWSHASSLCMRQPCGNSLVMPPPWSRHKWIQQTTRHRTQCLLALSPRERMWAAPQEGICRWRVQNGPTNVGLIAIVCSSAYLFRKAANSNWHQSLSLQVKSQSTSVCKCFLSWDQNQSVWLMQILSRINRCDLQNRNAIEVAMNPPPRTQNRPLNVLRSGISSPTRKKSQVKKNHHGKSRTTAYGNSCRSIVKNQEG